MTKLILKLLLSAMMVSVGALLAPVEEQNSIRTEAITIQKMIMKSVPQIHYEPIAEIKIESIRNNYENALNEMKMRMKKIEFIPDKKEWFLAYKSIVEEYENFFDSPETIYDCFSDNELDLLFHVVEAEIGNYAFNQKVNVASVIFNRIEHDRFPNELGEILVMDQFATISDGRYKEVEVSEDTILACEYAFQIEDTTGGCLFFDSNNMLKYEFVFSDGAHNFYTLKEDKKERGDLILLQE